MLIREPSLLVAAMFFSLKSLTCCVLPHTRVLLHTMCVSDGGSYSSSSHHSEAADLSPHSFLQEAAAGFSSTHHALSNKPTYFPLDFTLL